MSLAPSAGETPPFIRVGNESTTHTQQHTCMNVLRFVRNGSRKVDMVK